MSVERGKGEGVALLFDISTYALSPSPLHALCQAIVLVVEAKIPKFFNFNKQLRYYLQRQNPLPCTPLPHTEI